MAQLRGAVEATLYILLPVKRYMVPPLLAVLETRVSSKVVVAKWQALPGRLSLRQTLLAKERLL